MIPSTEGTWAIKVYVGTKEFSIDDVTYTVLPKREPVHESSDSDSSYENYVNTVVDQIVEFEKQAVEGNKAAGIKEIKTIEYNAGSISQNIMKVMEESSNTVLHYTTTYMGKKYDFTITKEIAELADKSVQWYGPLYIQHLINLMNMGYTNNGRIYTVSKGDTIYGIARKMGVSLNRLLEKNPNLSRNSVILPGQNILF